MKHTPGPWIIDKEWMKECKYKAGQEIPIFPEKGGVSVCEVTTRTGTGQLNQKEGNANARLIAAAPELLNELKDISCALKYGNLKKPKQWKASIDRIIAKAEGRQHEITT